MSQLSDQMTAAAATLSTQHGVTTDQVNTIVAQATAPFQASIAGILASEKSADDKIADIETSLSDFAAGVNPPATTAAGTPVKSAPDSAPATGGDQTANAVNTATGTAASA